MDLFDNLTARLKRCAHGLVPAGRVCPECIWEEAAGISNLSQSTQNHLMRLMVDACVMAVPESEAESVRRAARDGNWYALRAVRRWRKKEKLKCSTRS